MASTQATIDLIVRGSGAVNRLIDDISQLDRVIDRINGSPLNVVSQDVDRRVTQLANRMQQLGDAARDSQQQILANERATVAAQDRIARAERTIQNRRLRDVNTPTYRRLADQISEARAEVDRLSRSSDSAAQTIQNAARGTRIGAGQLIDLRETQRSSATIRQLAQEFNAFGDSMRRTSAETNGLRRIQNQITQLRAQTAGVDALSASIQETRNQIAQLSRARVAPQAPAVGAPQFDMLRYAQEYEQFQQEEERRARDLAAAQRLLQQQGQQLQAEENRVSALSERILANQEAVTRAMASRTTPTGTQTSLNRIEAQAQALALVANNSEIASSEFNRFTVAAEMASAKLARSQQRTFEALAYGLSDVQGERLGIPTPRGLGEFGAGTGAGQIAGARGLVSQAISEIPSLVRSEAALGAHIRYLEQLKSLVPFTSSSYRELENAIAGMNRELSEAQLKGQTSVIRPTAGPASLLPQFSVQSAEKQAQFRERQIADMWKMRGGPALPAGFTERGRISSEFGALGTAFLPVSGKMPGGQRAIPGSPQAKKEEADLQKKINSALIQQEELQGRIDRANLTEFQRQELTNRLLSARDAILKGNFDTSRAISGQVDLTRYSYERYNRDLVKSSKLASDLEKYTKQALGFASRLENISPAMFDSSDLDAFVNRFGEIEGIYKDLNKESKEAGRDFDQRLKAAGPFKDRLVELQTLSNDLAINSKRGVQVDQERAKVASLIQKLESGTVHVNQQNLKLVSDMTASLKKRLSLRISEAKVAGTYETGRGAAGAKTIAPERVEDAVRRLRARANAVESAAISLQGKGAANADQLRLQVQEKINELKKLEGNITRDNAESVARDLGVLQRGILDISNALGEARNQITQAAKLTGFDKSFETFQDSLQQNRTFFENVSPAEAIDKIVREFNQGMLAGPESGGGAATANNIIDTFSSSMKAGGGKVVSAASSVFNKVTQAINFAFGIASPSRFMIELVQNLANTYVSQLQKEYPRIKSATEKAFGQLEPRRPVKELTATLRGFETVDRPSTGFKPLANRAFDPSGAGGEMDEMFRRFRNQIAQLTTQPEIYRNILNALPSSSLTTDLAAAASRRAAVSELPSFMPIQRQLGPGELEKAIQSQFAEYLKGIKIPNPWIGPIGDYRNFIAAITGETSKLSSLRRESQLALPAGRERLALPPGADFQTIAESRIAKALERSAQRGAAVFAEDLERSTQRIFGGGGAGGGVPPSPPTPPGGAPDDFNDRFATASQQGVQGLLGLAELRDPSKVATARLEILSRVLQEVYSQLDPVAPGAKQLNKELRETIGTLNNLQASRAPDADPLVRITKNPRLAAGISEGLIGGAFPLLFGQGLGASVGGGLGGFAGGAAGGALGFGLSLIGTAVGSAVDTTVNNLKELASSLKEPTAALEAMKTAGLKVDSGLEDVVNRLEGAGNVAAAQALVFDDLESKIGKLGVIRLQELTDAQKKLESEWSRLNAIIASGLIPYAIQATSAIADLTGWIANLFSLEAPEWLRNIPAGTGGETTWQMRQQEIRKQEQQKERRGLSLPPLTPEGQRKQQLEPFQSTVAALSAGLEASDIAKKYTDAIKTAAEEQKDLDNQRFELIESYEQSIADIRKGVEDRITQERLSVIAKENELFAAQGEIRLQQLRNANAELRASAFGNEIGQQLVDAVSEFTEKQLSTENEIADRRRSLELELESRRIEVEQYRIDVANQVSRLNISTEKQVEKIRDGVLKKNQAYDRGRFETEKRINILNLEIKRLEAVQQESLFRGATNGGNPAIAKQNRELADLYANQATLIEAQKNAVKGSTPPPELSFRPVSASASVSTAGLDAVRRKGDELVKSVARAKDELASLVSSGDFTNFNSRLNEIADQGVSNLINQFDELNAQLSDDPLVAQAKKIAEAFGLIAQAPEIAPYQELIVKYQDLAEAKIRLGNSLEFVNGRLGEQISEIDSLRIEVNSAVSGSTELEKTLVDLATRGISPASEEFKKLTDNASRIDALREKLEIINGFKTASSELTLSLRGLIENFYELGSASEAVKRVGEDLSKKTLGFVLDIAFKPVEKAMQRSFFDIAEKLGFDIKPEQMQQLEEIKVLRNLVSSIESHIRAMTTAKVSLSEAAGTETQRALIIEGNGNSSLHVFDPREIPFKDRGTVSTEVDSLIRAGAITQLQKSSVVDQLETIYKQLNPNYGSALQSEFSSLVPQVRTGGRTPEELALRDMVSMAEGTWDITRGRPRYDITYGYQKFDTSRPHPDRVVTAGRYSSAAAGAYQFMPNTWKMVHGGANPPMTEVNQDAAFYDLVKRRGVSPSTLINRELVNKLAPEWASLPTLGGSSFYGQPVKSYSVLENFYKQRLDYYKNTAPAMPSNQIVPGPSNQGAFYAPVPGMNRYGIIPGAPSQPTNKTDKQYPGINRMVGGPQSFLPGTFTGIGGPALTPAQEFIQKEIQRIRNMSAAMDLPKDELEVILTTSETAMRSNFVKYPEILGSDEAFSEEIGSAFNDLRKELGLVNEVTKQATASIAEFPLVAEGLKVAGSGLVTHFSEKNSELAGVVPKWGQNLGQVVTGLSLASTAVIGIVGSIQNIKQGGAGNILSGIGSILTTVGGIGMSVAGMMKPAIPSGGFTAPPAGFDSLRGSSPLPGSFFANGDVFDMEDGIQRFANGGLFQSPTLFSFEDAGVTRTGQAGEAGVEAIMPLKRTKDGRLGVEADLSIPFQSSLMGADEEGEEGGDAGDGSGIAQPDRRGALGVIGALSVPFSRMGRSGSPMTAAQAMQAAAELGLTVPFAKGAQGGDTDGATGAVNEVIRFESTVINGQEYVTREEAEKIGRVAAARGADLAQKRIKNNPRVRESIGM